MCSSRRQPCAERPIGPEFGLHPWLKDAEPDGDRPLPLVDDPKKARAHAPLLVGDLKARTALRVRAALRAQGWDTGAAATQVVPVMVGAEDAALALHRHLEDHGCLAVAIRPPTVAPGQARIRLALNARHRREDLELLVELFEQWRDGRD